MSTCRSCGAEIVWARTEKGKRIPLDATPDTARGNMVLVGDTAKVVEPGQGRYVSHFATCPNAGSHRR